VVFFAVGFETTAPANALAVLQARALGLTNFALLVAHVTVPPAIRALLDAPGNRVQGFLAAGHVCTVMGWREYEPIAARYRVPIVVTGFEPLDLARGVLQCVRQLEAGRAEVENAYGRAVQAEGNRAARAAIAAVFEPCDRAWRGLGLIPQSGYRLRPAFAAFDAEQRFAELRRLQPAEPADCLAGLVLQGRLAPPECPAFASRCTPEHPLGATMVSAEGTCAAYYRYARDRRAERV
jgi:hydrogenase expression/formation protein HypD